MTACAALYTGRGVILACDSLTTDLGMRRPARKMTTDLGMRRPARKMWGQPMSDGWRFTACGDADVTLSLAAGTFAPGPDPRVAMHELRDAVRSEAARIGKVRTGEQGTSFVHVDIIAAHPVHGLWLIQDGQCVERWEPEFGLLAIGDPTAVRAAFLAGRGGPDAGSVLSALAVVGSVSAVVGGPYVAVESLDGHWGPEVVR